MLEDSGARWAFADRALVPKRSRRAPITRHALERVVALGGTEYEGAVRTRGASDIAASTSSTPRGSSTPAARQGVRRVWCITHGNLRRDERSAFLSDVEAVAPGDALLHAAPLSHGSGLYLLPHVARGAVNVVPESGGFDAARDPRAARRVGPRALLRGADDGAATGRRAGDRPSAPRSAEVHRVRRRPDVRRGLQGGASRAGPAARADLWPGRIADDDHRDGPRAIADAVRATTTRGSARSASRRLGVDCRIADADDARCPPARSAKCWCAARR